jgi:hypothetical protein
MWKQQMYVIHSGDGFGITCITVYNMHTFVASTRMHAVHSDDFRFSDGFGYLNLTRFCLIPSFHTLPCALLSLVVAKVCVCLMWSFFSIISLYLSDIWHDLYWTIDTEWHVLRQDWSVCSKYVNHFKFNGEHHQWEGLCNNFRTLIMILVKTVFVIHCNC